MRTAMILLLAVLTAAGLAQDAVIPSIEIPSIQMADQPLIPAIQMADQTLRHSLRDWGRRWAVARVAAGDALLTVPGRFSALWFARVDLLRRIATEGWTAETEAAWDAYWRALGAAHVRAAKTSGRYISGLTTP